MAASGGGIRAITGSALDDTALLPFIVSADCIIADVVANGCAAGKSQDCLDQAANYLGSHFLATSKVGEKTATIESERFENYQVKLKTGSNTGEGILSTSYGQSANMLLGGCLTSLDNPPAEVEFA